MRRPPAEGFRAQYPAGFELRQNGASESDGKTLVGHFAKFGEWAEIDSIHEGHFLERLSEGSFRKTISENRSRIRALFQHGKDPVVADKPLGPITVLREDSEGAYYEVPLLDTSYNADLIPGLRPASTAPRSDSRRSRSVLSTTPDARKRIRKGFRSARSSRHGFTSLGRSPSRSTKVRPPECAR